MSWDGLKDVVLKIGRSSLADDLVLRGSFVMRVWFGDAARDPGDVDFVAADPNVDLDDEEYETILKRIEEVLGRPDDSDDLDGYPYTYGWHFDYPDAGVDVAFGEDMELPAETIEVDGVRLNVVSREESLAWKLRWLVAEDLKLPKDLYDAVLLAESIKTASGSVDLSLARRLIKEEFDEEDLLTSTWDEHTPSEAVWAKLGFPGRAEEWIARLSAACGPWYAGEAE